MLVFGALGAMSVALGLYWLGLAEGPSLALPIGTVDAFLCVHACRQVGQLKRRADEYLALPDSLAHPANLRRAREAGDALPKPPTPLDLGA